MNTVQGIRDEFLRKYKAGDFVTDKSGVKTVELIGSTFIANKETIFGEINGDYIERELEWYLSQSLRVDDIPAPVPEIWKKVASTNGEINSNYGWCIFSNENGNQYFNVVRELKSNPDSRRASMIYTRPSMHADYDRDGMSDFICTYGVQYFIRDGKLVTHVLMRSNDAVFGYKNDYAWQKYVSERVATDIGIELGDIIWTASSLHVYERHFKLIEEYGNSNYTSL